jgi:hypothetical protein
VLILTPLFFATALIYAAAGFGGGSTYTALLALQDADPAVLPVVALACNILVVSIGSWRFARAGHVDLGRIWPLFAASVPMAFVGGALPVSRTLFVGLLALSLFVAGALLLWQPASRAAAPPRPYPRLLEPLLGGLLGLVAGIVGIGGGIYLAPVLHLIRWAPPHAIAGTSAVFILVNSLSGLAGQAYKGGGAVPSILEAHWPLFPAVVLGGLAGSALGARRFGPPALRILTALLILFAAAQLTRRFFALV